MADEFSVITYMVEDPVATIWLDRPDVLNAWVPRMDDELREAMSRAEADPAVVGIVVTGRGRAFSSGADLRAWHDDVDADDPFGLQRFTGPGDFDGRQTFPMRVAKPVIAAINGPVVGMALAFALACDVRVLSPRASFLTAFSRRGLIAEFGTAWLLPHTVGPSAALDLLWSSRTVDAGEAMRLGLANYLVHEPDELLPFCRRYVSDLAEHCSPASLAVIKRQVYEHFHRGLGAAERDAGRLMAESLERPDVAEGARSFLQKRLPAFPRLGEGAAVE